VTAKPGSTNPLKYGPYARQISRAEQASLRKMPVEDLLQEISVLRIFIGRLLDLASGQEDIEAVTKIAGSLSQLIKTLNTSLRTHMLLAGDPVSDWDKALAGALEDEPFYISSASAALQKVRRDEPQGVEAELWKKIFAVDPNRKSRRSR
jgi:hypothetical protein